MRILLDTNAFLWQISLVKNKNHLGTTARRTLEQSDGVYVSSISLVEIQIKAMLGRLNAPGAIVPLVIEAGDLLLPFNANAADELQGFPQLIRHDPFDRMLLAQAKVEKLQFYTADQLLLDLHLPFVHDCRQ